MDTNKTRKKSKKPREKEELQKPTKLTSDQVQKRTRDDLYSQIFQNDLDSDEEPADRTEAKVKVGPSKTNKKKSQHSPKQDISETQIPSSSKPVPVRNFKPILNSNVSSDEESEPDQEGFEFDNDSGNDSESDEEAMEVEHQEDVSKESEEEPESEESSDTEEESMEERHKTVLRRQLKDLSFEELEALKDKMGLKEYNEAMFGSGNQRGPRRTRSKRQRFERGNKNRPRELSSKLRVPKLREIVKVPKKIRKDPRFDDSFGEYNERHWNTDYEFLRDIQKKEAEELKKTVKSEQDKDKKKEMRRFIQKVSDKEKAIAMKAREGEKMKQELEENRKRIREGKNPYYVKQSTRKLMDLVEKYDELKSSGRLEKYLKKKRKKNAIRDQKQMKPIK